jgi:hypothetical protein
MLRDASPSPIRTRQPPKSRNAPMALRSIARGSSTHALLKVPGGEAALRQNVLDAME